MSRIGKKPIEIPENVNVEISDRTIKIKGSKGELVYTCREEIGIEIRDKKIYVVPSKHTKKTKAFWGLTRALIANMVKGVTEGFEKKLEIRGVGYRASLEGDNLVLNLGFSHPIRISKPEGIDFRVEKNIIIVSGIDKQKVGQIAAKIRKLRPPDPYKGKGIRYVGEIIIKKEGKKAVGASQ